MTRRFATRDMETGIEWDEKIVQFKDPVHGYIGVLKVYCNNLIDTSYMQRIKGVAQVGIRPLFSSATHDRFSHSLGVYMFAGKAYISLKKNIHKLIEENRNMLTDEKVKLKKDVESWKCLVDIAALLHDIGHPAGSHAFEFLYDDVFLQFDDDKRSVDLTCDDSWEKELKNSGDIYHSYFKYTDNAGEPSYENSELKKSLRKALFNNDNSVLNGSPHERMSAYMILKKKDLNITVKKLICAYWDNINKAIDDEEIDNAVKFICRMIIGQDYPTVYSADFSSDNYRNSIKNCIIRLINGRLDVDSMDYIMRNSYSAGYATHTVDCARLCSAFTVIENENIIEPCFAKTVLSVIEGFITARNFEPKWLYSHHKVVYYDVLIKSIYHYSMKFLCYLNFMECSDKIKEKYKKEMEELEKKYELNFNIYEDYINEYSMSFWHYPYFTYILAMIRPFYSKKYDFNATVDSNLDSLYKSINLLLKKVIVTEENKIFRFEDKVILESLLEEYENRKLKRSLWKSHVEYRLVIKDVAQSIGLSEDRVHDYMMDMIKNGLNSLKFYIGESPINLIVKSYKEQQIYYPYSSEEANSSMEEATQDPFDPDMIKYFAKNNAKDVFGTHQGEYDFSHINCVCKIYTANFKKNFDELTIRFDNIAYKISDIIDITYEKPFEIPYIYYSNESKDNKDDKKVKYNFIKNFRLYCSKRLDSEIKFKGSRPMVSLNPKHHVIRDVVHGDITFSDIYWDIINTKEFQRLRRIKQLATASQAFPNATHTRFAHSIGTYHVMKMIINHFKQIFNDLQIDYINIEDEPIALLAALLHDIGHGPFSHAFETVAKNSITHDEWAEKIILDKDTELNQMIVKHFGKETPKKVVDCINNVIHKDSKEINFSMIYSGLVSGSLDADRMDYLMRDSYNTNGEFCSIDIQSIISSMRIAQIDGVYYVCYDENYLSFIEQLIFTRYEMYSNIYFNNYKVLSESLVKHILQRAYQKRDLLDEKEKNLLETIFNANMKTEDFLKLDDNLINYYFYQWKDTKNDKVLAEMCRALIDRASYNEIQVADQSELNFQRLLSGIERVCGFEEGELTKKNDREFFGIIKDERNVGAYPEETQSLNASKIIWIMNKNGTVVDFRNKTKLYDLRGKHVSRIHNTYVYYSRKIMKEELIEEMKNKADAKMIEDNIELKLNKIDSLIESFVPRNHIEIEEKYRCDEETLYEFEKLLNGTLGQAEDILNSKNIFGNYKLKSEFISFKHKDIYYDTVDRKIEKANCSLRIRNSGDKYTCTIKLPVNSDNFGGDSQLARFEYETEGESDQLNEFANFIDMHLNINGVPIVKGSINADNVSKIFNRTLEIENNRKRATVIRNKVGDGFSCEVCLDRVVYKNNSVEKKDYQIEIELKSDYLHHVILKVFTNMVEGKLHNTIKREEKSKYERGLDITKITNK